MGFYLNKVCLFNESTALLGIYAPSIGKMSPATYVGEWRPHKPRGPIGAHFKSPGPKYALPGSTGFQKHDMRKQRNPAFSFGTRHAKFTNDCSPGPGYLVPANITKHGVDGTPKYSLYGRTKAQKTDNSPGPAAYQLFPMLGTKIVSGMSAPSYSMTGRAIVGSFHEDLRKTPGPGTYRVIPPYVYKNRGPLYSMTGRNMLPSDSTKKPGPGAHSPDKVFIHKFQPASHSFGIRHSEYKVPTREPIRSGWME